jgi:GNAT superfamily N-acetyltransferase
MSTIGFLQQHAKFYGTPCWKCSLYSRHRIVSSAILTPQRGELWLEQIYTQSTYQHYGYGKALMKHIIANPPEKKSWMRCSIQPFGNEPLSRDQLMKFYGKLGFVPTRKKRRTYQVWELDMRK